LNGLNFVFCQQCCDNALVPHDTIAQVTLRYTCIGYLWFIQLLRPSVTTASQVISEA